MGGDRGKEEANDYRERQRCERRGRMRARRRIKVYRGMHVSDVEMQRSARPTADAAK